MTGMCTEINTTSCNYTNISSELIVLNSCKFIYKVNQTYVLTLICIIGLILNVLLIIIQPRLEKQSKSDKMFKYLMFRTWFELSMLVQRSLNPILDNDSFFLPNSSTIMWISILTDRYLRACFVLCSDLCNVGMAIACLMKFEAKWDIFCIKDELVVILIFIFSLLVYSFR